MKGLIIREPWINLILKGRKTWEIRSRNTNVRGRIGLIRGGSGTVVGTANLVESKGPFTFEELAGLQDLHQVPPDALRDFLSKYKDRAYAWVLEDVKPLDPPISYDHPSGAVIWVNLEAINI